MSRRIQFIVSTNPLNLAGKAIASLSQGKLTALLVAATMLAVIGTAVACGRDSGSDELVVYSGRSESLVEPIIQQFRDATGMTVNVKYASTGELAATLLEEGDKSPADIFFAQDPGGLGTVEGLLDDLPGDILGLAPAWARSPESKWVGISGRARVVVYNTNALAEADLPDSIWDFTDPKWKGRIGWPPTNASFQAMVTGMRVLWGDARTEEWLRGIMANEPKVFPKNTPTVQAAADGEIDVGFVNHYYLHRFLAEEGEGFAARNYYTRAADPGSVVLAAGAGILKTANNREGAESFLKFLLSVPGQQYFASQTYEYPLVDGVKADRLLLPLDEITKPDIDLADLSDLAGTQDLLRKVGAIP